MARKEYKYKKSFTVNGKRKYIYARTAKELEEKLLRAKLEAGAGIDITNNIKLKDWYVMWWDSSMRNLKPHTIRTYRNTINNYILPILGDVEVRKITSIVCSRIFKEMDEKNMSHASQMMAYNLLSQMLQSATDNNIILKNPCNKSVRVGGKAAVRKDALTISEVNKVLEGIKRYGDVRDTCFIQIAVGTGLRRGEILGLRWEDVNLESDEVSVNGTAIWINNTEFQWQDSTKSKNGMRKVPFDRTVHDAFATLRNMGTIPYCFMIDGRPYSYDDVTKLSMRISRADKTVKCTPHILRHTYITRLSDICNTNEMMRLAGHSSSSMTDRYTHYTEDQYQATKKKLQSIG